jgi:alpha/beta superfamily hydrolase
MERIMIPGPVGELESLLEMPRAFSGLSAAVLCHPHPLYGGTMRNKVVARMALALLESGLAVVRFNFRGVEASAGTYDAGRGEVEDACAVFDYLTRTLAPRHFLLAGFSFGAWVAARSLAKCSRNGDIRGLLSVGTPADMYDYNFLQDCRLPMLFIHGDEDAVCDPEAVAPLVQVGGLPRSVVIVKGADHFFTGRLRPLQQIVTRHYQPFFQHLAHANGG